MKKLKRSAGFTLIEVIVAVALFVLITIAVYGAWQMVFKAVYKSRINIIETALIDERLEIIRNLAFNDVGLINGAPQGLITHSTTTVRSGVPFLILTSIRSIDDPFDGVLGGSPNDTSPADYKFVEINIQCLSCKYPRMETTMSTIIPPRDLEGSTNNGAVYIYVSDSQNNGLPGANVHIENTALFPNIIIDEVTDKDGYLRIVDIPTSTMGYQITVSKDGYSSDYTAPTSSTNLDPVKPFATISSQNITDIYFSIDRLASLTLHTLDESCDALGFRTFKMEGDKKIGEPNIKKYSQNLQTNSAGDLDVSNLEFDRYTFDFSGSGYDVAGAIPMVPLNLTAGSHADQTLVLAPHTSNSLLVGVVDNDNSLPVSDATVELRKNSSLISTKRTDYGFMAQSTWEGGAGQETFVEEFPNQYYAANRVDVISSPGNFLLETFLTQFLADGTLESSVFDIGKKVDLKNIIFTSESWPVETGEDAILIQLAASNSSSLSTLQNFIGPDGTSGSYYSTTNTLVYTGGQLYRFFRYKVFLKTNDQNFSPVFSNFALTFTNGCTPPGQVFFSGLSSGTYELRITASGYDFASTTVDVAGQSSSTIKLRKSS